MKCIQLGLLLCTITSNHMNAMDCKPGNSVSTIFSKFNHEDSFAIISFNPDHEELCAIKNWQSAHQAFRKQWAILRQTPEYNAYYKAPKKNRFELKTKKNSTKEGISYLTAKNIALSALKLLPSVKIREISFKIVSVIPQASSATESTNKLYCIAFDPMFIKYNDF